MTIQDYVKQEITKKRMQDVFKLLDDIQELIELETSNVFVGCKKCRKEFRTTKEFLKHKCKSL